ncbi:MAG: hypothetical protein ACKVY0_01115 [Prosthecobacter sp.]|uniref:hypothetical protein n=1 Tax=Prosthecobacter sp. TaxID=1965333 RepID=UPI003901F6F9
MYFKISADDGNHRAFGKLHYACVILSLLLAPFPSYAQSGTGNSLIVAGTTTTNGSGSFAWIALQPTDPSVVMGKQIAVYRKSGGPTSASSYSRVAILEPAADVRIIGSLLTRANVLGENLLELNSVLSELLEDASAAGTVTVAQKMSAFISGAWGDNDKMKRVMLVARQRPSVALCAGLAHMERVSAVGVLTYELRDFNTATSTDIGVVGRVTVDPAAPLVLPAPGAPVELPDTTSKGNLNVTLRWATPNTLRDLAPLHHGFDVYRVPKAIAMSKGWHTTPPTTVNDFTSEPTARKINTLAILTSVMLTAAEAANLTNDTVYVHDDNGRFKTAGTPFADGAQFYYFAVARDLLGNGGTPSPGTLVEICDRLPPNQPKKVKVRNVASYNGTVHDQRLEVSWEAPDVVPPETIAGYRVYRWRTPSEIPTKEKLLNRNLIAIVPATTHSFIDDGSPPPPGGAVNDYSTPAWPTDNGKTYFYTVRAIDGSVCGNVSGNSPPVFGVLRDREGPAGSKGEVSLKCFEPLVSFTSAMQVAKTGLNADTAHLQFVCTSSLTTGLAWAEFKVTTGGSEVLLGRSAFKKDGTGFLRVNLPRTLPKFTGNGTFFCRVATPSGTVSAWVPTTGQDNITPQAGKYIELKWNTVLNSLTLPGADCGWRHQTTDPVTGDTVKPTGSFIPSTGSREWKLYRRVNSSAQTLIAQGEIPAGSTAPTTWTDSDPPKANCTVCYFLELTDEHGNPGQLMQQGECATFADATALPTPMLEPLKSVPPLMSGKMQVSWMCSTAGVERFELWVSRSSGSAPSSTGSGLSTDLATHLNMVDGKDFAVFQTALARHLSPTGTPEYSVELPVSVSDAYTVMVRAVGSGSSSTRAVGAFSNVETFTYTSRDFTLSAAVPWPDRPLPPQAAFHPGIQAAHLNVSDLAPWKGNGIRIGEYSDPPFNGNTTTAQTDQGGPVNTAVHVSFNLSSVLNVEHSIYVNQPLDSEEGGKTVLPGAVFPVALYRVQIANSTFPVVSGDVVQVSPLMERIAQIIGGPNKVVTDPFIAILHESDSPLTGTETQYDHDIFLLDRQPVIKGATYKYILVRFSPTKEIERVIVTNTVDVPL